jgi:trehalose-6-phosphatase
VEELKGPLATLWGVYYPTGYVVAILPDDETAQQASEALAAAGFSADDVRAHPGQEVVDRHEQFLNDRGTAERMLAAIPSHEREALDEYIEEAREGSAFVTVQAPQEDRVKRAHAVLAELGAYGMRHYDRASLHDLD